MPEGFTAEAVIPATFIYPIGTKRPVWAFTAKLERLPFDPSLATMANLGDHVGGSDTELVTVNRVEPITEPRAA